MALGEVRWCGVRRRNNDCKNIHVTEDVCWRRYDGYCYCNSDSGDGEGERGEEYELREEESAGKSSRRMEWD